MNKLLVLLGLLFYSLPSFSQFNVQLGSTVISQNSFYYYVDDEDTISNSYRLRQVGLSISFSKDLFEFGQNNSNTIGLGVNTNYWVGNYILNTNIGGYFSKNIGKSNLYTPIYFGLMSYKRFGWSRENKLNLTTGFGYSFGDLLKFYAEVLYSPVFNTDRFNPLRIQVGLKWKKLKKYN